MLTGSSAEIVAIITSLSAMAVICIAFILLLPRRWRTVDGMKTRRGSVKVAALGTALVSLFGLIALAEIEGGGRGTYLQYLGWWGRLGIPLTAAILAFTLWMMTAKREVLIQKWRGLTAERRAAARMRDLFTWKEMGGIAVLFIVAGTLGALWAGHKPG